MVRSAAKEAKGQVGFENISSCSYTRFLLFLSIQSAFFLVYPLHPLCLFIFASCLFSSFNSYSFLSCSSPSHFFQYPAFTLYVPNQTHTCSNTQMHSPVNEHNEIRQRTNSRHHLPSTQEISAAPQNQSRHNNLTPWHVRSTNQKFTHCSMSLVLVRLL